MSNIDLPKEQDLVEYRVDRLLEEATTDTRIVVLSRQGDSLDTFPIWVGAPEGNAIKLALDTMITPRPMSHDLITSFAEHLNITIQRVVIADVKNSTYYANEHSSEENEVGPANSHGIPPCDTQEAPRLGEMSFCAQG